MEIERKFLVENDAWRGEGTTTRIRQGYLSRDRDRTVRIRIRDDKAYLTIKGRSRGFCRPEFEYEVPVNDAQEILRLCAGPVIEKTRHRIKLDRHVWEVDEFHGDLTGLILAECELESEDQAIDLPGWVGKEVTGDPMYYNSNLSRWPFV